MGFMKNNKLFTLISIAVLLISGCNDANTSSSSDSQSIQTDTSNTATSDTATSASDTSSTSGSTSASDSSSDQPINSYYDDISITATGLSLQTSLRSLVTTTHTTETTYDGLREVFKTSDADPNNRGKIIWFYTGTSVSFSGFGGSNGDTNREHVWPKDAGKAFPETSKAGSDAHHLRPTETQINSIRGNKSFDIVPQTSANIAKQNGSTTYATGDYLSYTDSNFFYPGKGFRGQTARILFYVQLRWGQAYNLRFVLGSGSSKTIGDIETLMQWHLEEPASETELTRNEVVYGIQGNRNPFIDVPNYACRIYANDGQSYNSKVAGVCNSF